MGASYIMPPKDVWVSGGWSCGVACAKAMWFIRKGSMSGYPVAAGAPMYYNERVVNPKQAESLFCHQLGMRVLDRPKVANLSHALRWSPVTIVFDLKTNNQYQGLPGLHVALPMVVIIGHDSSTQRYRIAYGNPLTGQSGFNAILIEGKFQMIGIDHPILVHLDHTLLSQMFYW